MASRHNWPSWNGKGRHPIPFLLALDDQQPRWGGGRCRSHEGSTSSESESGTRNSGLSQSSSQDMEEGSEGLTGPTD